MKCGECKACIENEDGIKLCFILSFNKYNYLVSEKDECQIDEWAKQRDALNAKEVGDEAQKG